MEQKTNQAKQKAMGSAAETGALHDEQLKDVAGGGLWGRGTQIPFYETDEYPEGGVVVGNDGRSYTATKRSWKCMGLGMNACHSCRFCRESPTNSRMHYCEKLPK